MNVASPVPGTGAAVLSSWRLTEGDLVDVELLVPVAGGLATVTGKVGASSTAAVLILVTKGDQADRLTRVPWAAIATVRPQVTTTHPGL